MSHYVLQIFVICNYYKIISINLKNYINIFFIIYSISNMIMMTIRNK